MTTDPSHRRYTARRLVRFLSYRKHNDKADYLTRFSMKLSNESVVHGPVMGCPCLVLCPHVVHTTLTFLGMDIQMDTHSKTVPNGHPGVHDSSHTFNRLSTPPFHPPGGLISSGRLLNANRLHRKNSIVETAMAITAGL